MAYLNVGGLPVLSHSGITGYTLLDGLALPRAAKRSDIADALRAGGNPTGEYYDLANRSWPLMAVGASDGVAEDAISALNRSIATGAVVSWSPSSSRETRTARVYDGGIDESYDRSDPLRIPFVMSLTTEPYWYGPSTYLGSGTYSGATSDVTVSSSSSGDMPAVVGITLTGLVVGHRYRLLGSNGSGDVAFTAMGTTFTITGSAYTGTAAPALRLSFLLIAASVTYTLSRLDGDTGSVSVAATYSPRYLSA